MKELHIKFKVRIILMSIFVALASVGTAEAQQCGPGCPACSGKAVGDLLPPKTVLFSGLFIPEGEEETAVFNLRYGLFSWMDAGIGYTVDEEEVIWSVRVEPFAQDLDGWRPALILGTGSVQAGGSDQSAYVQLVKTLEVVEGRFGISVAGGYATDIPDFKENWGLGNFSVTLFDRVSPFYIYDGINSHIGFSFFFTEWLTLSGFVLEMEEAAVSVGLQWCFDEEEED
jgi:hypothetical protein